MNMKKTIYIFLVLVGIIVIFLLFFVLEKESSTEKEFPLKEEAFKEKSYTVLFTGDIMLNRGVKHMVEKHGQDYTFPFLNIKETLWKADILFGNLESVISDRGTRIGSIYSFRADPAAVKGLSYAGFDVVSLANNHAFDYDREAFEDTMAILKEKRISYTGAGFNEKEAHSPTILTLDDSTKIGFLGYTEFLYPYAYADKDLSGITNLTKENLKKDIEKAKKEVDLLIVTFHYGDEYQKKPNEYQKKISRKAVDYGADIIIGHHPHVAQPVEKYNEKYIVYSLGNFIFDQYFSEETMRGFMFEIEIKEKKIVGASKIHYELNEYYQPKVVKIKKID